MKFFKIFLFFLFIFASYQCFSSAKKRILIIESYHSEFSWDASYKKGIRKVLGEKYNIHNFEIDTKRHLKSEYTARAQLAWEEYLKIKPVLVFLADDNALKLLEAKFAETDTPVVYLGINNNPRAYDVTGKKNITEGLERPLLQNSIRVIKDLISGCKKVLILLDSGTTSSIIANYFHSTGKKKFTIDGVKVEVKQVGKIGKWKKAVLDAKKDGFDAIIFGMYHTIIDKQNKVVDAEKIVRWSSKNASVPPFCFWDFAVGPDKTIGGIVLFGESQGEAAGKIALRILNGESPGI